MKRPGRRAPQPPRAAAGLCLVLACRVSLACLVVLACLMAAPAAGVNDVAAAATPGPHTPASWQIAQTSVSSFNAVSCANDHYCVAAGSAGGIDDEVSYDGATWGSARQVAQYQGDVVSLSCPVTGWCMAITDLAAVTVLHKGHWSALESVDPNPGPPYPGMAAAVSCTSPRFCVAVDAQGSSETFNGDTWAKPSLVDPNYPLNDVACVPGGRCVAVDGGGQVLELDHGRWSGPEPTDNAALTAVSCATAQFCAATDILGRVLVYGGSSWSEPTAVDQVAASPLSVSCPGTGRCVVVDGEGRELTLSGGRWTRARVIDVSSGQVGALVDVSCPIGTSGLCAAVDADGDALYYGGNLRADRVAASEVVQG